MPATVILGSARTPVGKLGGALAPLDATTLGGVAMAGALERAGVAPEQVEHIVMGTVLQAGQGMIPSRQAQAKAGIPVTISSETINKVCASGMRAVSLLDVAIRAGDIEVGLGGGMESMSNAPHLLSGVRFGVRLGDTTAHDAMLRDGLESAWSGKHMAEEATEVAAELEITRAEMDRWAVRSHERAIAAMDDGRFAEEIVAVTVPSRREEIVVEVDEAPRRDTTLESLAKLPPIFVKDGSHTAGNSPGVNDGAGAIVVASDAWARAHDREVLATIIATAQVADEDFRYLARTPAAAARAALAEGRARALGRRRLGDQRGLRLGRDRKHPAARDRRGSRQRQRRRGCARSSDRRFRRADPGVPRARAAPARRRRRVRRDLLGRCAGRRGHRPRLIPAVSPTATERRIRVVVAKPGLDGHDRGAKIIARALRDAGMEVIYTGLHQTPEQIVETVVQEDADAVGLSILSGAHMTLVPRIIELLAARGAERVVVTVGGTIPAADVAALKALGVAEVFTPGASTAAAIDFIRGAVGRSA